MKLSELKTIDIVAKQWRDTINGNSYFSSKVTLNYGMNNEKIIELPFQYGYEEAYLFESLQEVKKLFPKSYWFKNILNKWSLKEKYNIKVTNEIIKNCKKRELNHCYNKEN